MQREVEDDSVVADPESAAVVAAAANGEQQVVSAREGDRRGHVRGAGAAGDQRGPAVDHRVVDRARLLVARVGGTDQLARELRPELSSRCLCRICGAHICLLFVDFAGVREVPPDRRSRSLSRSPPATVAGSTPPVMTWIDTVRSPAQAPRIGSDNQI